jgi:hypothetical protein
MELEQFVDQLLLEKGVQSADPGVQAQLKEDLLSRIEDRVQAAILENLPESELETFEGKLDTESEEGIQTYLRSVIPNFDEVIAQELLDFKNIYLS